MRQPTSSPTMSCRLVSTFVLCGSTHGSSLVPLPDVRALPHYRRSCHGRRGRSPMLRWHRFWPTPGLCHDATSRTYRWGVARFLESGHLCQCHGVGGAPELGASPPSSSATSSEDYTLSTSPG
ncbi:hypothetical protein BC827DRAFT_613502 [Russula dissimulans]|nr:hypothetical protein BC827DRAFT_613502 [Russula dissimulans]